MTGPNDAPTFLGWDLLEDGWVQPGASPAGWEAHTLYVRADLVSGEPRVTGIRLEPRPGSRAADAVLTSSRLRTLPLHAYAAAVYHFANLTPGTLGRLHGALDSTTQALDARRRRKGGRASTTPEAVAQVYAAARLRGEAPRAAVCAALSISSRTADRYISRARKQGLLGAYDETKEEGRHEDR